jgi:hypothetical protein
MIHPLLLHINKQEGHDGPEVALLYKGPRSGAGLNPQGFYLNKLGIKTPIRRCFMMLSFCYTHIRKNNDLLPHPGRVNFNPRAFI